MERFGDGHWQGSQKRQLEGGLKGRMVAQSKATRGHSKSPLKNKWITPTTLVRFNATRWSSKVCKLLSCLQTVDRLILGQLFEPLH